MRLTCLTVSTSVFLLNVLIIILMQMRSSYSASR